MAEHNTCAAVGCGRAISHEHLMCMGHWKMVPATLQKEVYSTWRNVRRDREAYADARERAIAAVERKLNFNPEQGNLL